VIYPYAISVIETLYPARMAGASARYNERKSAKKAPDLPTGRFVDLVAANAG